MISSFSTKLLLPRVLVTIAASVTPFISAKAHIGHVAEVAGHGHLVEIGLVAASAVLLVGLQPARMGRIQPIRMMPMKPRREMKSMHESAMSGQAEPKYGVMICGHGSRSKSAVTEFAVLAEKLAPLFPKLAGGIWVSGICHSGDQDWS